MVKIPERPDAYLARGLPDARLAGGGGGAETFDAISQGARKLAAIAGRMQDQRDHDLLVEAQNRYTKQVTDFTLQAEQNRTGDRARGFTRDYSGQSDTTRNDVTKWLKDNGGSGMAERAFGNWATGRKTQGAEGAARFEHGQLKAHSKDLFDQRIQAIVDQVEHNPGSFADAAGQLQEAFTLGVGQGLFRPEEAKARLHDAREKLSLTSFDNMYAMNRGQAMQSMEALGMTPAQQAKAKKKFQADVRADAYHARQARAEQKAELGASLPDADYLASQTGDVGELRGMATEFRKLGDVKTAERIERRAGVYENNYAAIKESQVMPIIDLETRINALDKEITDLQGQGAVAVDARKLLTLNGEIETRKKIYANRVKEITDDPMRAALASAVVTKETTDKDSNLLREITSPGTAVAIRNAERQRNGYRQGEEPQAPSEANTARLMARQKVIGQGISGFVPEPMTKAQAKGLKAQWDAEPDAGKKAAMLAGLQAAYGKYFPAVAAQAKLPDAVLAIAPVMDNLTPAQIGRMITASEARDNELPKTDNDVKAELASSSYVEMARELSSVMFTSAEVRDFAAQTVKTFKNYARMGGSIAEIEKNFFLLNADNVRILAPKKMEAPGLENGFVAVTRELKRSIPEGSDRQSREHALRLRAIYENGHWIYDGADGFAFIDAGTGLAVARYSRDEILNAANQHNYDDWIVD
jgi:hypothetical protein